MRRSLLFIREMNFSPCCVPPCRASHSQGKMLLGVLSLFLLMASSCVHALGLEEVQFRVVDRLTHQPMANVGVFIEDKLGRHHTALLLSDAQPGGITPTFDLRAWKEIPKDHETSQPTLITLAAGTSVLLQGQPIQNPKSEIQNSPVPPVKDIYIKVTAVRLIPKHANATAPGTTLNQKDINNKAGVGGGINKVIEGTSGVASDSAGQQHVRGEHADIAYVVDGVPLPDTLSGRSGAVVVPATIQRLEILTGGFAPEFGGQTAAILNLTTLPGVRKARGDAAIQGGDYDTLNGNVTALGPLGKSASYVLNLSATSTRNALEPQQPDNQTAHNAGSGLNAFANLRFTPGKRDTLTLTVSHNPGTLQISNRTGLPALFASAGQGFGFLGARNADGTRPDVTPDNANAFGAETLPLLSQQNAGQDITQREVSEFATLSWKRQIASSTSGLLALTFLHAGQDLHNQNPAVDVLNLPVDNSIEFNPTSTRNIHHLQLTGSLSYKRGQHEFKTGLLWDDQNGDETYNLIPASRLALNELAALSPSLAPSGAVQTDANGNPVLDVNGNPVYVPSSGTTPTLKVHRSGFYRAAYAQDTWQASKRLTFNYGVRLDWYKQSQTLGQPVIDTALLSPRLNFSYALDRRTTARWSYNRLFNTPPLAQGAVIGQPIQPETLDQYDVSMERQIGAGQTISLAYYVKQIRNQVDTGLFIPGSQIGIYSAVNLAIGGVHGIEFAYDLTPPKGYGFNASLNYTYSVARPNGLDNTGAPVPDFNDHDQRNTLGVELGYTWKSEAGISLALNHGSGLASSPIPPSDKRIPRTRIDLHLTTGNRLFRGRGGIGLDIQNLLDNRTVINFQSAFSGTRFQQGRTVLLSVFGRF